MTDFSDGGVHGFIIEILPVHISAAAHTEVSLYGCNSGPSGSSVSMSVLRMRSALSDVLSCRCRQLSVAMLVAFDLHRFACPIDDAWCLARDLALLLTMIWSASIAS